MHIDWQTPLALFVVVLAAASLVVPAWLRQRRRAESKVPGAAGGCASGGEGCGCSSVKKALRPKS